MIINNKIATKNKTIITILLLILFNFSGNAQSYIVNQANNAIATAKSNPTYENYLELITKCSKAIEETPDYDFYYELITTYYTLAKARDYNELYFYEQAIAFNDKYLKVADDNVKKEAHRRFAETLKNEYSKRKQTIEEKDKREKDDEEWRYVNRFQTKTKYKDYLTAFPTGEYAAKAREAVNMWEDYEMKFPSERNVNMNEAKEKLVVWYSQSGDKEYEASNYELALNYYEKADGYTSSSDIKNKISLTEEQILYGKIKRYGQVADCEMYVKDYPRGKYIEEAKAILCPDYFQKAVSLYRKDRNTARNYFDEVSKFGCTYKNEADNYIKEIDKKNKIEAYNIGYQDRIYYSYIFETNNISGYGSDFLQGVSFFTLKNKKCGIYFSYRASNSFYPKKNILDDFPESDYTLTRQSAKSVSSIAVSMGGTTKIFRPLFCYWGLGIGSNLFVEKYSVTNLSDDTESKARIVDNTNTSFRISPEAGLIVGLSGASILFGIRYPIPLNKATGYNYKGLNYMLGLGFGIKDDKGIYREDWWYFSYNFDLGHPNVNFSFSKEESLSNKGLIGFSWGLLKSTKVGFYMSYRSNIFFYGVKKDIDKLVENGTSYSSVTDNNLHRISKAFLTFGITRKIQYPIWFYAGLGCSYYSESRQLTLHDYYYKWGSHVESEEEKTIWEKVPNSVIWGLNPEIGITFNLWGFTFGAGINHPLPFKTGLKVNKFSPQFSFTIGGAWRK